jgi:hypothetical protein
MELHEFLKIQEEQLARCVETLSAKAWEYADKDRLHNFKVAAELEGVTVRQALAGMMAKHTVSIYDMCKCPAAHTMPLWDEKITDHINYLILLRAVVEEESQK